MRLSTKLPGTTYDTIQNRLKENVSASTAPRTQACNHGATPKSRHVLHPPLASKNGLQGEPLSSSCSLWNLDFMNLGHALAPLVPGGWLSELHPGESVQGWKHPRLYPRKFKALTGGQTQLNANRMKL